MERAATCTFTGHRENKLPWRGDETDARCLRLKQHIFDAVEAVYHSGVRHYICGMANAATCTLPRRSWPCGPSGPT